VLTCEVDRKPACHFEAQNPRSSSAASDKVEVRVKREQVSKNIIVSFFKRISLRAKNLCQLCAAKKVINGFSILADMEYIAVRARVNKSFSWILTAQGPSRRQIYFRIEV